MLERQEGVKNLNKPPCIICGQQIQIRASHANKRKTCGRVCGSIYRSLTQSGEKSCHWKGGRGKTYDGYIEVYEPTLIRGKRIHGHRKEHIKIAEIAFGNPLPPKAVVHHVNEAKTDNRNSNLVICQDSAYHVFLHQRTRAYNACSHPNWRKCKYCKEWDDPNNLKICADNHTVYHHKCMAQSWRDKNVHTNPKKRAA